MGNCFLFTKAESAVSFAKETYNFKEPIRPPHTISRYCCGAMSGVGTRRELRHCCAPKKLLRAAVVLVRSNVSILFLYQHLTLRCSNISRCSTLYTSCSFSIQSFSLSIRSYSLSIAFIERAEVSYRESSRILLLSLFSLCSLSVLSLFSLFSLSFLSIFSLYSFSIRSYSLAIAFIERAAGYCCSLYSLSAQAESTAQQFFGCAALSHCSISL